MAILFAQILNMSLTASVVILCVMAARLLLKRFPKIFSYALWSVVLFRLLCPVSLTAPVSVLEVTKPQTAEVGGISYVAYAPVENVLIESGDALPQVSEKPVSIQELQQQQADTAPTSMEIISYVWLAGIAVMVLYSVVIYLRLYRNLVGAICWRGNVYLADHIASPFVLGTLFPKIYLPSVTPMKERRYIIAHEQHHIRRCDHIIKLLAYAALCVHWFNPLVWAAFVLAGKDMEMSCDEAVIKKLGEHIRADYSASLLRLATHKKIIAGTPLAFGEGDTKGRVLNMAKWKRPKVWVSILCAAVCLAVLVACAVNPAGEQDQEDKAVVHREKLTVTIENDQVSYGGFSLTLPEGYSARESEDGVILSKNGQDAGGVTHWPTPEIPMDPMDEWVKALGLPEIQSGRNSYMIQYVSDSRISAGFQDEVDGTGLHVVHEFYVSGDIVYDIWFDRNVETYEDDAGKRAILRSVEVRELEKEKDLIKTAMLNGPTDVSFGDLDYILPTGYMVEAVEADAGDYAYMQQISDGTSIIGGVVYYNAPDFKDYGVDALELWEASDETLGYMGGGSLYGDYEIEYFTDLPEPVENPVNRKHYFFTWEDAVYDFWFDQTVADYKTIETIMKTAAVGQNGPLIVEAAPTETEALEKCRAVLEAVQSGSHHISLERLYGSNAVPSDYIQEYLWHEDNWLNTITVQIAGTTEKHAALYADGRYFNNMGKWSEEEILWTEMKTEASSLRPWLTSFQWHEDNVTYVDTLNNNDDTVVMLRIDEPYPGLEAETECYWVDFCFDPSGSFIKAELEVDYIRDNEVESIDSTEAIVTLDPAAVAAQISKEYFRATGEGLPSAAGNTIVTDLELYQKSFTSDDGTVTINFNTAFVPEQLEVENGLSMDELLAIAEDEFRSTNVDSYGLDTTAMGYVGATCELNITEIRAGDSYLVSATEAVPTLEIWGERIYHFANGDQLGQEQGAIRLLLINPEDGTILTRFGRKN